MNSWCELSVVMSVYNGQDHLEEAIDSILNQSFTDFEFIIINDGSTDKTRKILDEFAAQDFRIRVIHQENSGLAVSLNRGIRMARGNFIARQDADDVSLPERLEKQMTFLQSNPQVVLCGTWFLENNQDKGQMIRKYPLDDQTLRKYINYVNFFCHPSVMFLKEAFIKSGGYDEQLPTGQDFEFWMRLCRFGEVRNIPQVLIKKRIGFGQAISWQQRSRKLELWQLIFRKHFKKWSRINIVLFARFYLPLLVYQYIPVPILKLVRAIRYR